MAVGWWCMVCFFLSSGYPGYQYPSANSYPATAGTTHYTSQIPASTVGMYHTALPSGYCNLKAWLNRSYWSIKGKNAHTPRRITNVFYTQYWTPLWSPNTALYSNFRSVKCNRRLWMKTVLTITIELFFMNKLVKHTAYFNDLLGIPYAMLRRDAGDWTSLSSPHWFALYRSVFFLWSNQHYISPFSMQQTKTNLTLQDWVWFCCRQSQCTTE